MIIITGAGASSAGSLYLSAPPGPPRAAMAVLLEIMTSDYAKPVSKPETFRSHLPAVAAAAAGTVLAAVLGSLMGTAGTVAGMAIGSVVSGTCSWWAEQGIRRSTAIAAARAGAIRARGSPLRPDEDAAVTQVFAARYDRARRHWRWAGPAALAAAAFIACAVSVTLVEQAAGKPMSALVQGKPGHGTTLDGGVSGGTAPASPAPAPAASTAGPAATAPASNTAPGPASSSPAASPTPAATTPGGAGPAPSTLPSAVPTAAPTVPVPGTAGPSLPAGPTP